MEDFAVLYTVLLGSAPMFVAALVGIVMAALWWSRARHAASLTLIACLLQIALIGVSTFMTGWYVPHAIHGDGIQSLQHVMMAWSVAGSVLHAVVFGLLIWAVFAGRNPIAAAGR